MHIILVPIVDKNNPQVNGCQADG